MPTDDQVTKAKLLELVRSGRAQFEALIAAVTEDQMVQPATVGPWSVKDLLAHVSTWDRRLLGWLAADARGEDPHWPEPDFSDAAVARVNERDFLARQSLPLSEVLAEFRASCQDLVLAVEAIPEADQLDPHRYRWLRGRPLWRTVAANTYWHYEEHVGQLRSLASEGKWLRSVSGVP